MSAFFYIKGLNEKIPYYYISKAKLINSSQGKSLMVSTIEMQYTYYVDVAIWNNGLQFIDFSDFVESQPISLKANGINKIIRSDLIAKSRAELNVSSQVDNKILFINMKENEALEQGDGVCFRVFFNSYDYYKIRFNLMSRIKGTKDGFKYINLKRVSKATHTSRLVIGWFIILVSILIRSVGLMIVKNPVVFRQSELIILLIIVITWTYYTYEYIYFAINLPWLNL
ncbi:hypothetical protein ASG14_04730 [Pedobacter sp. Leaf194]|nr:hypothetical protein ASG14_04730 [Pedobacter sp. Leaf194]